MNPLSDKVVSLLRTVVPVVWGSAIAWLLTVVALPAPVTGFLTNQTDVVVVVAIAAWYAGFRWLEPKLPPWLTRIVLGSNQTPTYAPAIAVRGSVVVAPQVGNSATGVNGTVVTPDPVPPVTPPAP
jgi:hypothetical protein